MEAAERDIDIRPPHVNVSTDNYEYRDGAIFIPLTAVKYLGDKGAMEILSARAKAGGKFSSIEQFASLVGRRGFNDQSRRLLYSIGGFDGMPGRVTDLIKNVEEILLGSDSENQLEALGFAIPTAKISRLIRKYDTPTSVAGFVESIREKEKERGKMYVVMLSPRGSFWTYDKLRLKKGDFLIVRKSRYGKGEDVKKAKL